MSLPFTANEPESVIKLRQCQPGDDADILRENDIVLLFCIFVCIRLVRRLNLWDGIMPVLMPFCLFLSRIVGVCLSKYLDCIVQQVTRH